MSISVTTLSFTRKSLRVSILAGRTGPKVFMQVAADGSALYINGEWFWEAEHCINHVNIDRQDDVENIIDIHRGVGTLKMLHQFLHILTPLFIDFDAYLKERVLMQENVSKRQVTPEALGTRVDDTLGVIGDLGCVLEELLLGRNQRLFVKRSRVSVCDIFWKLRGIYTETILFDQKTRKPTEFASHSLANEALLLFNLTQKEGPFDFDRDFRAIPETTLKKRVASNVEDAEVISQSGRKIKKNQARRRSDVPKYAVKRKRLR